MIKLLLILSSIMVISCADRQVAIPNDEKVEKIYDDLNFTNNQRNLIVEKRQDSTFWNMEMLEVDLSYSDDKKTGPFTYGAFPVPNYDLLGKGTFTGLGNFGYNGSGGNYKNIKDKIILYNSFFIKKNKLNEKRLRERDNEVFFQILVLTDTIDSVNYSHVSSEVISRNHPDYIGQGFYRTKNSKIDYVAFATPEKENYAIVNARLFNLNYGKTILIAPQKDGSLRSMQVQSPKLSSGEIDTYTDKLLMKDSVVKFFTENGNI